MGHRRLAVAAFVGLLMAIVACDGSEVIVPPSWGPEVAYPMRVGDTWTYHRVLKTSGWIAVEDTIVVRIVEDGGSGVTLWENGTKTFLVHADEGTVSVTGLGANMYRAFVFPLEVGRSWSSASPGGDLWSHEVARVGPISVPAGDFARAYLIKQDGRETSGHVDTYHSETWLAEGVGMIRDTVVSYRSSGSVYIATHDLVEYSPAKRF